VHGQISELPGRRFEATVTMPRPVLNRATGPPTPQLPECTAGYSTIAPPQKEFMKLSRRWSAAHDGKPNDFT
jgi:hypothetical protein